MLDALIVGAGIGGLVVARALAGRGFTVRVLERAPSPPPAGAGLLLAGNARACLAALGRFERLEPRGRWITDMAITDARGAALGALGVPEPGDPAALFGVHRRALHEVLLDGVEVEGDTTVLALDAGAEAVTAELSTGEAVSARLVIGADGIGSSIRNLACGPFERRYAGYTCWRVVVADPGVTRAAEMWGRGQRVGLVPIGRGRLYAFLVENAPPGTWARPTTADGLRARFARFGGDAARLLEAIDETTDILHHDIEHHPVHHFGEGRIALLGDAAHALTPNMGQGAAMAIEDAYVLAERVEACGPGPAAVAAFAAARRARVRSVARRSLRLGQIAQWKNPLACALRSLLLRASPASAGRAQVRALVAAGPAATR